MCVFQCCVRIHIKWIISAFTSPNRKIAAANTTAISSGRLGFACSAIVNIQTRHVYVYVLARSRLLIGGTPPSDVRQADAAPSIARERAHASLTIIRRRQYKHSYAHTQRQNHSAYFRYRHHRERAQPKTLNSTSSNTTAATQPNHPNTHPQHSASARLTCWCAGLFRTRA